jgi:hypothetical protein
MRMRMGQIVAAREGSSAAEQGVVTRDPEQSIAGDIIKQVEVVEPDGSKTRLITARGKATAHDNVKEMDIDPLRLPFELERWAQRSLAAGDPSSRKVLLTVFRGLEHKEVSLELAWDDSWRFDREVQMARPSPLSIPELGIAYRVECKIEALEPDSPAAKAGLKEGDVIEAVRYEEWEAHKHQAVPGREWHELERDQWAWSFAELQRKDFKQVTFRVKHDKQPVEITVAAQPDPTWPQAERGLLLTPDYRLQKATAR